METVYFVGANYRYGQVAYLPYAAGCIAAYAWADELVKSRYRLGRFIFMREDIAETVTSLDSPFLVAFSCYVWNFEYNKALARAIKEKFPNCLILFGGHHIPFNSAALLDELGFVDFLVHEEGEEAFLMLLRALAADGNLRHVPNLSYRANGEIHRNPVIAPTHADYPSPYLNGLFDDLMREEQYEFSATLETNRGCPFTCAFCDWGTLRGELRKIPMERIHAEIKWFAEHKIDHVYCADANFGIFPRDGEIVDFLVDTNKRTGYPQKFRACYTKNSDEAVFQLNKRLNAAGMSKGATLSFQSVSPTVLKNIGRKNLSMERFSQLLGKYQKEGIPTQSELILGLPGETLESFIQGVGALFEAGQHSSLNIYTCEMLPNALLARLREKYAIETIKTRGGRAHCSATERDDAEEITEIVCATDSLSRADWEAAQCFSVIAQAWHCLGVLQLVAIYLREKQGVKYQDFYSSLIDWARENPQTMQGEKLLALEGRVADILKFGGGFSYADKRFGDVLYPFEEALFLESAYELERFYSDISPFLLKYLDAATLDELIYQQKKRLKMPKNQSWADYAREVVWYGRKGNIMLESSEI